MQRKLQNVFLVRKVEKRKSVFLYKKESCVTEIIRKK